MKNKFIRTLSALLLTGILVVGLSACGGNSKSESSTESESKVSETETVSTEESNEAENEETENAESTVDTEDPTDIAGKTVYYGGLANGIEPNDFPFSVYCPEGFTTIEANVFSEADISNAPERARWIHESGTEVVISLLCRQEIADHYIPGREDSTMAYGSLDTIVVDGKECTVSTPQYDGDFSEEDKLYGKYTVYVPEDTAVYEVVLKYHSSESEYLALHYDSDIVKEIISSIKPL